MREPVYYRPWMRTQLQTALHGATLAGFATLGLVRSGSRWLRCGLCGSRNVRRRVLPGGLQQKTGGDPHGTKQANGGQA